MISKYNNLNHELINHKYDYATDFMCNKCGIELYTAYDAHGGKKLYPFYSDIELNLTCEEIIIKNIIE